MSVLAVLLTVVVVGVLLWAVNTYVPMDPKIKKILNIAVVLILIVWLMKVLGLWAYLSGLTV